MIKNMQEECRKARRPRSPRETHVLGSVRSAAERDVDDAFDPLNWSGAQVLGLVGAFGVEGHRHERAFGSA